MIMKTVLVAALVLGSASTAFADSYHDASNRYQTRYVALSSDYWSARESWMDRASRNWSGGGY